MIVEENKISGYIDYSSWRTCDGWLAMVIKNRTQRNSCLRTLDIFPVRTRLHVWSVRVPRVQMRADARTTYTFHLRAFKFCAIRIHFERGQAVIYACGACGSRPWRGNNSSVKGGWDRRRAREKQRKYGEKRGMLRWKSDREERGASKRDWWGERTLPPSRDSLRKVQRYKALVIYFGLPWLVYPLIPLVRSLLEVFKRTSSETTSTNKHRIPPG